MPQFVGPRRTRRTTKRLARLRVANPGALPRVQADDKYTPREARKVRRSARKLNAKEQAARPKPKPKYDPLQPLTNDRLKTETKAAERLEFGPRADELRRAVGRTDQTAVNREQYYDDYRQALRESTARVNEANRQNVEAAEARVDSAFAQDSAGVQARDAAASEAAAKLGRGPVQSAEGSQAVMAARSQGNQSAARLRGGAAADTRFFESRGATAALGKAQDQDRMRARRDALRREEKDLAGDRGAFRTNFRRQSRQDERQYAAIQKEFGLKVRDQNLRYKQSDADRQIERQKLAAQKIVARMYSSADRASARAQVRVAQLQLQKGKITKNQFKTIRNIYEGLPGGGGKPGSTPSKPKLQTWERDKVDNAVTILRANKISPKDKQSELAQMQKEGMPLRLARIAWNRYMKYLNEPFNDSPGSDRAQG
jgi:hypothetical protein